MLVVSGNICIVRARWVSDFDGNGAGIVCVDFFTCSSVDFVLGCDLMLMMCLWLACWFDFLLGSGLEVGWGLVFCSVLVIYFVSADLLLDCGLVVGFVWFVWFGSLFASWLLILFSALNG